MSCDCLEYICLDVIYNPCSEGAELAIEATETGTWSADLYFNGVPTQFSFGVTQGENIVIPTEFLNEYYTHEFRLYNGAGTLLACYQLKARYSNNAGEFTPIPPTPDGLQAKTFTGNGTDTQVFTGVGHIIEITIPNQIYTESDFVQTGESVTMDDGVTFYGIIVVKWENS
jgi:hypothetical protein